MKHVQAGLVLLGNNITRCTLSEITSPFRYCSGTNEQNNLPHTLQFCVPLSSFLTKEYKLQGVFNYVYHYLIFCQLGATAWQCVCHHTAQLTLRGHRIGNRGRAWGGRLRTYTGSTRFHFWGARGLCEWSTTQRHG